MKAFIFVIIFSLSLSSQAGSGWISSGGELFEDAFNPWFLRNTLNVRYCIDIEESSVTPSVTKINTLVTESIQFWKNEFAKSAAIPSKAIKLGTQNFTQVSCQSQNIDLHFLFGYGTLNQEKIDFLKQPRKYIGVAVRTNYDPQNLKGKGFIFIASDQGSNAYDHVRGNLIQQAWQHEKLLKYALLHELGHVFGLPHTGTGLMSEVFLDQLLSRSLYQIYLSESIQPFLHADNNTEDCHTLSYVSFFQSDARKDCISIERQSLNGLWTVYARNNQEPLSNRVKIGEIRNVDLGLISLLAKPSTIVKLTDQQTVFTGEEIAGRPFMVGPLYSHYKAKGVYISDQTRRPQPLQIDITPENITMTGVLNRKPVVVFNSVSPINLLLSKHNILTEEGS